MRTTRILSMICAAALVLTATACSDTDDATGSGTGGEGFPITIEHALGTTVVESEPQRVATVGWANHEVALSLGVVPVGMAKATWGDDDDNGVLPWVEDKLTELGAATPALFDETDAVDFEAVADSDPDVILAAYSGLTQDQYDTLSKIAPVVAYPTVPWGTTWQQMIELDSTALGLAARGQELIADLEGQIAAAVDEHRTGHGPFVQRRELRGEQATHRGADDDGRTVVAHAVHEALQQLQIGRHLRPLRRDVGEAVPAQVECHDPSACGQAGHDVGPVGPIAAEPVHQHESWAVLRAVLGDVVDPGAVQVDVSLT